MKIESPQQLQQYREAAKISTEILWRLHEKTREGVTPREIDALADELCLEHGVRPNFKGVGPAHNLYQYATCISVNDVVVHGIPASEPLRAGDLVKVDFGIEHEGLHTDHCFTVGLAPVSSEDQQLLEVGRQAVLDGVRQAVVGNTTGDIGHAIESAVLARGFSVPEIYIGHGIGRSLHEGPEVPAWGDPGAGTKLERGMVLCVEAQVIAGENNVYTADDGWSVKTVDGSKAVMFEYMVVVEKHQPTILTPTTDWPLTV